jgi:hypothetical protein
VYNRSWRKTIAVRLLKLHGARLALTQFRSEELTHSFDSFGTMVRIPLEIDVEGKEERVGAVATYQPGSS